MEVQVSKDKICINKLVAEKKEIFFVKNDMIVPDTKPDILNTINITGNVCIYKKELIEDKVKIDGNINTYIMYMPDSKEDNLRALNCNLDFSENISVPGAREGMNFITKYVIKDLECKVLNGRKITVKASVEAYIKIYSNEEIDIINKINNIENIQTLGQDFNINSLLGCGKTVVYAKDTLNIENQDELAEILKVDINLGEKDTKISYNKILAKAELDMNIMYLTEDNRIGRVVGKIPVVGFIDMQSISEENICDVNYELKNMVIRPNSVDEHSIYVELEIEQSCMAYEKKEVNLIQDLYSPTCNVEFSQRRIASSTGIVEKNNEFTIKEKIKVPDILGENIVDVETCAHIVNIGITSSKITHSGELSLNFIYTKEERVNARNIKIPFEFSIDNLEETDKINVETEASIKDFSFNVQELGEIECEIKIEIITRISKNIHINIIENIELVDNNDYNEEYDSLIMYIVKHGDTLWKIAKRFNSTVEELVAINGIEDKNKINIGQKIYIPKFNSVKKENNIDEREQVFI